MKRLKTSYELTEELLEEIAERTGPGKAWVTIEQTLRKAFGMKQLGQDTKRAGTGEGPARKPLPRRKK